jgi:hypothetical protein
MTWRLSDDVELCRLSAEDGENKFDWNIMKTMTSIAVQHIMIMYYEVSPTFLITLSFFSETRPVLYVKK